MKLKFAHTNVIVNNESVPSWHLLDAKLNLLIPSPFPFLKLVKSLVQPGLINLWVLNKSMEIMVPTGKEQD